MLCYGYITETIHNHMDQVLEKKMRPWITKKITQYFGEPEESVIAFTVEQLVQHIGATETAEALRPLLMGDCDDFVFKMWRMLVFELLSAKD